MFDIVKDTDFFLCQSEKNVPSSQLAEIKIIPHSYDPYCIKIYFRHGFLAPAFYSWYHVDIY